MAVASLGNVGNAVAGAGTTLVIPITADIPGSDPVAGATIILVSILCAGLSATQPPSGVIDDGPTDPAYGTCLFSDGLNHYTLGPGFDVEGGLDNFVAQCTFFGLILNPLDATCSITITFPGDVTWAFATARAYTGVNVDTSGANFPTVGTDAGWMFSGTVPNCPCGVAVNDDSAHPSHTVAWDFEPDVTILSPSLSTDGGWVFQTGDLAFYNLFQAQSVAVPTGAWTWTDPDIGTVDEFDDMAISPSGDLVTFLFAEQPIAAPQSSITLDGTWATGAPTSGKTTGGGGVLLAGPGPSCPVTPPPGGGVPIFNNHIRLSE